MSNFPDAHKVYDLASVFRQRVIEEGRSFLWPEQKIWTVENANHLLEVISTISDANPSMSIQQTADELSKESDVTLMMAADAQALNHFFWASIESTLRQHVGSFLNLRESLPPVDAETWTLLIEQASLTVPASWTFYKGTSVSLTLSSVATLAALCSTRGEQRDVATLEPRLLQIARPGVWHHWVWSIAHVLFPDEIMPLPAEEPRHKIINQYKKIAPIDSSLGEFAQLRQIREYLQPQVKDDYFDFYHPAIYLDWERRPKYIRRWAKYDRGGPIPPDIRKRVDDIVGVDPQKLPIYASISHVVKDFAPVYEIASLFQDRVIDQGMSLLWPEREVWSADNIDRFLEDFKANRTKKGHGWLDTFRQQVGSSSSETAMILADAYAMIMQFPSIEDYRGITKTNSLRTILDWIDEDVDQDAFHQVTTSFEIGIGSPGTAFVAAISHQIAYVVALVKGFRDQPDIEIQVAADTAVERAKSTYGFQKTTVPARNTMLHLLDPERFERIASRSHKQQIIESFETQLEDLTFSSDDMDTQLREVRYVLAGRYFPDDFDFYDQDVLPYWNGDRLLTDQELTVDPVPPPISDLAAATFLDEDHLRDIESLLRSRKQLIFEGPPGSGKTFVAEKFARYFTGQSLADKRNEQVEMIQFHQSYGYEDFVEGIRPETNESGQLVYEVRPGIMRELAAKADLNPDKKFVLIIDEINRGNVSRVLGELMLLLEYRDQTAKLQYSKDEFQLPPNLYIIGTMNSADRSLSQIDYALRRRFYFVRFLSVEDGDAKVLRRWLRAQNLEPSLNNLILGVFTELNERLRKDLDTDDLQVGHSYLMDSRIGEDNFLAHIWKYSVIPLIREYLYHHRDRDELLQAYELQRLARIVQPIAEETGEPAARLINKSVGEESE